jgi:thymidylate synthase (FAD)
MALIERLLKNQHNTPFEHAVLRWYVKCPIFVARQWMRHRIGSYNERSLRYTAADREYYIPGINLEALLKKTSEVYPDVTKRHDLISLARLGLPPLVGEYIRSMEDAFDLYERLVDGGWKREQARGILGTCVFTEFVWTVNTWSFMNWLGKRLDAAAQAEHREYAGAAFDIWYQVMPNTATSWAAYRGHTEG